MGYSIGIDTGGTFTDGFFVNGARVETVKVSTTPHDLTVCFLECIKAGAQQFGVAVEDMLMDTDVIRFSTTVGTNTLIERNGTKIGLLVSQEDESSLQVVSEEEESPLVYPQMVRALRDVGSNGEARLDRDEVLRAAQELLDQGARCLVVSLKNSDRNPWQERQVRAWIKEEYPRDYLGSVPVFLASDITQLPGDQERTNTAVVNAYIHARLVRLLYKADEDLRKRYYSHPLLVVHATGGVTRVAKTRAIHTYNSGPAAGLMGVLALGRQYGARDLVSADMGGTSFDVGFIKGGQPSFSLRPKVEGLPLSVPMVAIRAIGAGGGSIASIRRGELRVGPQSAGALPGPACFNLGGTNPTVTDADVVLGYIDPDYFLGGRMKLDRDKAYQAIQSKVASPLGVGVLDAALAIRDTVDASMGQEIKALVGSMGEGFNPTLVVYGGAGPTHCCGFASHAGIKKIITSQFAPVFSASAASSMDIRHIYSRRLGTLVKENSRVLPEPESIEKAVVEMQGEALRDMRGEGFGEDQVSYVVEFLLSTSDKVAEGRVVLQGLDWKEKLAEGLQKQVAKLVDAPQLYASAIFLHASTPIPSYEMRKHETGGADPSAALKGTRQVCWTKDTGMATTAVYDHALLAPGHVIEGPAIVDAPDTTYAVAQGWIYTVDAYRNGILQEV